MNREDIIRMAREASLGVQVPDILLPVFERFATLVASAEREACAKVCEDINSAEDYYGERPELICSEAIRARGQA